jgi:hypothetical protein
MLVLGSVASQNTKSFLASASFESIATVSIASGSSQSTITFSSIPSTYKHLQLRAIYRSASSNVYNAWFTGTLNGDTGANYSQHGLFGNGSTVTANGTGNSSVLDYFSRPGSDAAGGIYGAMVMDILDYASTNKYKTTRHLAGVNINVSTTRLDVGAFSNNWRSTSAINSISFYGNQGQFTEFSSFALYGIK